MDITPSYTWEVASPNRLDSLSTCLEAFQSMFDFNVLPGRPTVAVAESFSFSQCPSAYILLTTLDSQLVPGSLCISRGTPKRQINSPTNFSATVEASWLKTG